MQRAGLYDQTGMFLFFRIWNFVKIEALIICYRITENECVNFLSFLSSSPVLCYQQFAIRACLGFTMDRGLWYSGYMRHHADAFMIET